MLCQPELARRKRHKANLGAAPIRVLQGSALVAARGAPRPPPQYVARCAGTQRITGTAHASGPWCRNFSQNSQSHGVARCRSYCDPPVIPLAQMPRYRKNCAF